MAVGLLRRSSTSSHSPARVIDDLDSVTCPICLEIYEKPRVITCGHIFCKACLYPYDEVLEPLCPLCRKEFKPGALNRALELEKFIQTSKGMCTGCAKKLALNKLRNHLSSCEKVQQAIKSASFQPVASTTQHPKPVVNRYTFKCPFCSLGNLDVHCLREHCNEQHAHRRGKVVCPVCAVMPWGNPNQKSDNFLLHLNLRHQFEYDTLVDYELDESAALELALKVSLEDK